MTGNARGYVATWAIESARLVLKDVHVDDESVVKELFPGREVIHATWFTGYLSVTANGEQFRLARLQNGKELSRWRLSPQQYMAFSDAQFAAFQRSERFQLLTKQVHAFYASASDERMNYILRGRPHEYLCQVFSDGWRPPAGVESEQ